MAASAGSARTRSGDEYKPSALRGYEAALRLRVLPALGGARISAISRVDVQDLIDSMLGAGASPSTIRNTLIPLRVVFRRALDRGQIALNPTSGLRLPAVRGARDRVIAPNEAQELLLALPHDQRALWATAFYAGLRRGELQALGWQCVGRSVLRVERSWDRDAGYIEPKSRAGRRSVPVPRVLSDLLEERRMATQGEGLAFGRSPELPFDPSVVTARAARAWAERGLSGVTLHECRHSYASFMIHAGVNAKTLSAYMGHSSIVVTLDRYGHLMPGNEEEAAGLLEVYLARTTRPLQIDNGP